MKTEASKVCPLCGWHVVPPPPPPHVNVCDPDAGTAADELMKATKVPSTKLGYGFGNVTFELNADCAITFRVGGDGSVSFERLHWLVHDDVKTVAAAVWVVEALWAIAQDLKMIETEPDAPRERRRPAMIISKADASKSQMTSLEPEISAIEQRCNAVLAGGGRTVDVGGCPFTVVQEVIRRAAVSGWKATYSDDERDGAFLRFE